MPLDLRQYLLDEIKKEAGIVAELDEQIIAKTGKLQELKAKSENKISILKKSLSDFDKANKK